MGYRTAAQMADVWGVSARSVRNYCAQGRVPGAFLSGKTWNIPEDAPKPVRATAQLAESPLLRRLREEVEAGLSGGIYHKVQVELAYNSNRIEGSRLSHDQTRQIFETATIEAEGGVVKVDDIVGAANHFRCFDYVLQTAQQPLSAAMLKRLHELLKRGTSDAARDWFSVGDWKRLPNEVGGRETTPPEAVGSAIEELLTAYCPQRVHTFDEIVDFHVRFERIHPFQDGNGRVGRLVMFKECLASGIVPFVLTDDAKPFYYRGLAEWDEERGYLRDTCLAAQDQFKAWLDYFRIPYEG